MASTERLPRPSTLLCAKLHQNNCCSLLLSTSLPPPSPSTLFFPLPPPSPFPLTLRWSKWGSLVEGAHVDWKDMCRKRFCVEWWLSSAVEDLSARMVTVEHVSDHTLAVLMEGSAAGLDTAVLEEVMWQAVVQEHT